MMRKNNKGFTLVELLAVIVIMGILMMVAIPAATKTIINSRKDIYLNDAKALSAAGRQFVIDSNNDISEYDTSYYIHIGNLTELDSAKSPWAEWEDSYVIAVVNRDSTFDFYWTSMDKAGWKIDITESNELEKNDVYNDSTKRQINNRNPIPGTNKIVVIDKNGYRTNYEPRVELTEEEAKKCFTLRNIPENQVSVLYYNISCGTDVVIPAYIDGKEVVNIYNYAFSNMGITSVYIPDTIQEINISAFSYNELKEVIIPSSVKVIGNSAFFSNKIENLKLSNKLTSIGPGAFKNNQLTEAIIPESVTSVGACAYCQNPIANPSFWYVQNGDTIDYSRLKGYIGDYSEFPDKKLLIPSVVNGVQLKYIENNAFDNAGLKDWELVIPEGVISIGFGAFRQNDLVKVNFPSTLTNIGSYAFYLNKLEEIIIPPSVTSIGDMAFQGNATTDPAQMWIYKMTPSGIDYSTLVGYSGANRNNIVIPETAGPDNTPLKTIYKTAFLHLSLKGTVKIPSTVTSIEPQSFSNNTLTSIDNGDGKLNGPFVYARKSDGSIDYTTLVSYGARSTANVIIPDNVKVIEKDAFYYTSIKQVEFPEGLTTIGEAAFQCKLEGTIVIPSTVTSIGKNAFTKNASNNMNLTKIINKTGKSFDWKAITTGPSDATFETGIIENWYGNIEVVKE